MVYTLLALVCNAGESGILRFMAGLSVCRPFSPFLFMTTGLGQYAGLPPSVSTKPPMAAASDGENWLDCHCLHSSVRSFDLVKIIEESVHSPFYQARWPWSKERTVPWLAYVLPS